MIKIEKIKSLVKPLAKKYQLSLVVLFGSQVTGKTHAKSDVDFGFISEKKMSLNEIAKMQLEFSQKLKIKDLEFTDLKNVSPFLMKQVSEESILLYEKERSVFNLFKIYAFKLFVEAKPLLELREKSLNKFLKKA